MIFNKSIIVHNILISFHFLLLFAMPAMAMNVTAIVHRAVDVDWLRYLRGRLNGALMQNVSS